MNFDLCKVHISFISVKKNLRKVYFANSVVLLLLRSAYRAVLVVLTNQFVLDFTDIKVCLSSTTKIWRLNTFRC